MSACRTILGLVVAALVAGAVVTADAGSHRDRPRPLLNACAGDLTEIAYWKRALKSADRAVRLEAVRALAASRAEAARTALLEALGDEDEAVRAEAARALDRLPPRR